MDKFTITVEAAFDSAHRLLGYPGDCARLHGHRWTVQTRYTAARVDHLGMTCDFKRLKQALQQVIERLDHHLLNEVLPQLANPTAELIARYIYGELLTEVATFFVDGKLQAVTIFETPGCSVTYEEEREN